MAPSTGGVAVVVALVFLCTIMIRFAKESLHSNRAGNTQRAVLPSHYNVERYMTSAEKVPGLCPNCGANNSPEYKYCSECGEQVGRGEKRRDYLHSWDQ